MSSNSLHCNENLVYVFLFWELFGLSPHFHIHVSASDLCIPRICSPISCSRICRSLSDTWRWKLGLWLRNSFSGNICIEFSVLVLFSVYGPSRHSAGTEGRIPLGYLGSGLSKQTVYYTYKCYLHLYEWILRDGFSYVRVARGEEETAAGQPIEHEVAAPGHVVLNTTEYNTLY